MNEVVLDASAVLALVNRETGWEEVAFVLEDSVISTVNLSEVVAKLADAGLPEGDIRAVIEPLGITTAAFDEEDAIQAGLMRPSSRKAGLSFGDRACLALATRMSCAAMTADRRWMEMKQGPQVKLIRQ